MPLARPAVVCPALALVLSLPGCALEDAPFLPPSSAGVVDGMVDVGHGLSMHLHCQGRGRPVVLLDAGFGMSGTEWQHTQRAMAEVTTICAYDRAGEGYSDTPGKPHTLAEIDNEVRTLLARARIPGPYVVLGHSMGGLLARMFAAAHPDDVAGLVLVDASSEDQFDRMKGLLPPDADAHLEDPVVREHLSAADVKAAAARLHAGNRSLGGRPLVVLTAGHEDWPPGTTPEVADQLSEVWRGLQAELASRSTNATQIVAEKSSHFMAEDVPELVVAAVKEAVLAVRERRKVEAAPLRAAMK